LRLHLTRDFRARWASDRRSKTCRLRRVSEWPFQSASCQSVCVGSKDSCGSCTAARRRSKRPFARTGRPSSAEEPTPAIEALRDQRPLWPMTCRPTLLCEWPLYLESCRRGYVGSNGGCGSRAVIRISAEKRQSCGRDMNARSGKRLALWRAISGYVGTGDNPRTRAGDRTDTLCSLQWNAARSPEFVHQSSAQGIRRVPLLVY